MMKEGTKGKEGTCKRKCVKKEEEEGRGSEKISG